MKQMPSKQVFYELYNKNSPKNPKKKIGPVDAKLLLRDLSLPVAYSLAKIGVSANTVTVAFLIISLIGNTLFIIPSIYTLLVLIILGEFAQLLDCVDGQLARFHGTTSLYGRYFDKLSHELINGSFLFAFGIRVFLETHNPLYLILGGIGAFSVAFGQDLVISKNTFFHQAWVINLLTKSRISRLCVYIFQGIVTEVRIFGIFLLLSFAINLILPKIPVEKISFVSIIIIIFLENTIYRVYITLNRLKDIENKSWKGWKT